MTADDQVLLGPVLSPEDMTVDKLNEMDINCLRANTWRNLTLVAMDAYHKGYVTSAADAWAYGVSKTYLEPIGIKQSTYFSWNSASVSEIVSRNKGLNAAAFVTPKGTKPFPIIGSTLVGPSEGAPYNEKNQNYTFFEMTPLYVGNLKTLDVRYDYSLGTHRTRRVGGLVEPFGYSFQGKPPMFALKETQQEGMLSITEAKKLDLMSVTGASSYAPGSFVNSLYPSNLTEMGMHINQWSPADYFPIGKDTYLADGGAYENVPLISFLQRQVNRIVIFFTPSTPLQPSEKYNPYTDEATTESLSDEVGCYFGVFPKQAGWENRSFEYEQNQVFAKSSYAPVIAALQAAQKAGTGIVAEFDLVTVENKWRGIPAGFQVKIVFSYLGRLSAWEARLKPEMVDVLVPKENASDLSVVVTDGPYKKFPHYGTTGGSIDADNANVLADLTAWQVTQNADLFRSVLG